MPTFCLSMHIYICVCIWYVYKPAKTYVPKLSQVHMGGVRPKINDVAVVYWQQDE